MEEDDFLRKNNFSQKYFFKKINDVLKMFPIEPKYWEKIIDSLVLSFETTVNQNQKIKETSLWGKLFEIPRDKNFEKLCILKNLYYSFEKM